MFDQWWLLLSEEIKAFNLVFFEKELDGLSLRAHEVVVHAGVHGRRLGAERQAANVNGFPDWN